MLCHGAGGMQSAKTTKQGFPIAQGINAALLGTATCLGFAQASEEMAQHWCCQHRALLGAQV